MTLPRSTVSFALATFATLAGCDTAPKAEAPSAATPRAAAEPAAAPADDAKPAAVDADETAPGDDAAAPKVAVADDDAAGDETADAPDTADTDERAGAPSTVSTKMVLGLPTATAWTPTGPFAAAKLGAGELRADPAEAGDGELPQSPEKNVEPDTGTFINHVERFGWSADGKSFALCTDNESGCTECRFTDVTGTQERMDICGPKSKAEAKWKAGKYAPGPREWAAGGEVTITWTAHEATDDDGPDLVIGVRADGSDAVANVARMQLALGPDAVAFPELLVLDATASHLAVVGHGWMGEGSDSWQVRLIGTGWLAAQAYHAAGLKLLRDGKEADAAGMFTKATVADPGPWKHPYNAACAFARAKDANAEAALAEAIRRGGATVKTKARTDADFDGVRTEAWFSKLVPAA